MMMMVMMTMTTMTMMMMMMNDDDDDDDDDADDDDDDRNDDEDDDDSILGWYGLAVRCTMGRFRFLRSFPATGPGGAHVHKHALMHMLIVLTGCSAWPGTCIPCERSSDFDCFHGASTYGKACKYAWREMVVGMNPVALTTLVSLAWNGEQPASIAG